MMPAVGRRRGVRWILGSVLLALLVPLSPAPRAQDAGEPPPGTSWRWRDERGQVHLTDDPEGIPLRHRAGARAIAPISPPRDPSPPPSAPLAAVERTLRSTGPGGVPLSTAAVVTGEALLVWVAAGLTGMTIDLSGVAIACAAAAFVRWLDVPLVSSMGSFLVLFLVLWRMSRTDGAETLALFFVVVAVLHALSWWVAWRMAAASVGAG